MVIFVKNGDRVRFEWGVLVHLVWMIKMILMALVQVMLHGNDWLNGKCRICSVLYYYKSYKTSLQASYYKDVLPYKNNTLLTVPYHQPVQNTLEWFTQNGRLISISAMTTEYTKIIPTTYNLWIIRLAEDLDVGMKITLLTF